MRRHTAFAAILALMLGALPDATAQAWEPLRSANDHVERGNERMAQGDAKRALQAYDQAARELPDKPGVHLNRGLALLQAGKLSKARQALLMATEPPASNSVRADAYYNLGLGFYREADKAAGNSNHEKAQKLFRESADALRRSLRAEPGNAEAAWNLELAQRRIREQQKKQRQKQKKQQQARNQRENQSQQQNENQSQGGNKKQNEQDQSRRRANNQQDQQRQQDRQDGQGQQKKRQNQQRARNQKKKQGQQNAQQQQQQRQQQQQQQRRRAQNEQARSGDRRRARARRGKQGQQRLPPEARRVLEALEDQNKSLQQHLARQRGARQRREPEKDW